MATKTKPKPKRRARSATSHSPIDRYLATVSANQRAALEKLRRTIRAAAPNAEECISYGLPAFRLERPLVAFAAARNHCAFYPMSGSLIEAHQEELAGYETSKGTIRFPPDRPLPAALVRKLVKARIAEIAAAKPVKPPPSPRRGRPGIAV